MLVNPSRLAALPPGTVESLSTARHRLLTLLQTVNFGRIEMLVVRGGEPVFDPLPRIIREIKFAAGENGPRPEAQLANFALKDQHRTLFALLDRMRDGTILVLTVKHGLPFHAEVPV